MLCTILGFSHFFCLRLWRTRALIVYSLTLAVEVSRGANGNGKHS